MTYVRPKIGQGQQDVEELKELKELFSMGRFCRWNSVKHKPHHPTLNRRYQQVVYMHHLLIEESQELEIEELVTKAVQRRWGPYARRNILERDSHRRSSIVELDDPSPQEQRYVKQLVRFMAFCWFQYGHSSFSCINQSCFFRFVEGMRVKAFTLGQKPKITDRKFTEPISRIYLTQT